MTSETFLFKQREWVALAILAALILLVLPAPHHFAQADEHSPLVALH
jgi:hypothetical protein